MKKILKLTLTTAAALLLCAGLVFAQQKAPTPDTPAGPAGRGFGVWSQLTPEKQEAVRKLMAESQKKIFELSQQEYAKQTELEALLANPKADQSKAQALTKEIADLNGKIFEERISLRQKISKETGINLPFGGGRGGCGGRGGSGGCGFGPGAGRGCGGFGPGAGAGAATPPCCQTS